MARLFVDDRYLATTQATYAEVTEDAMGVVRRLSGRLYRALTDDTMDVPNFQPPSA